MDSTEPITLEVTKDGFAIITLCLPKKKNALSQPLFKRLAALIQVVDQRQDVFCTIVTGKGDFFSAGADVKAFREAPSEDDTMRDTAIRRLSEGGMNLARALQLHSKILVAALNGPAIGLSAGILGWFDFIYAVESAYILTPFSTLSLVAEGGASLTFPRRMGIAKANEALIMGKKLGAAELLACGFINKIFPQSVEAVFMASVMHYLNDKFLDLDRDACLVTKQLIKATSQGDADGANARELFEGAERQGTGLPKVQFEKIANKQKRHKL